MKMTSLMLLGVVLMVVSLYGAIGMSPPVCGDNARCCKTEPNNKTHCKNTTNENGKGMPCPKPWSCVCNEGFSGNPCLPDGFCNTDAVSVCSDLIEVPCDGTTYVFTRQYLSGGNSNFVPTLFYYINYQGDNPITVSTCNPATNYDTKLAIFDCEDLSEVQLPFANPQSCAISKDFANFFNDDNCPGFRSQIDIDQGAIDDGTYLIGVSDFGLAQGTFELSVTC
ncbi:uncharacterized protein LOC106167485 [Lingula anatina]|uniref:Uncharacterized protein LOC106167485 n=1 Tax=Lingula anatina TaxID=7574 RepID=A0A1S3IUW3_LINAN|nr:uncharacterized protein LOC106167485 [Lingula anatina]|eukprot:XP_013401726.1 uncharacterized protein LOC106167485 [Lingula anatina]